eukprot:2182207-Prymnesium_polylepis.1
MSTHMPKRGEAKIFSSWCAVCGVVCGVWCVRRKPHSHFVGGGCAPQTRVSAASVPPCVHARHRSAGSATEGRAPGAAFSNKQTANAPQAL